MDTTRIYFASYCEVEEFVTVFCLKNNATGKIFFFCDWCGLAWHEVPCRQVKASNDLDHEHIVVHKKDFDLKFVTPEEYESDEGDYFYFYFTDAEYIDWRETVTDGVAFPQPGGK